MKQARWQTVMNWPLTIAALLFLLAYAWQILGELEGIPHAIAETVMNVTWLLFVVDYIVNLALAPQRWRWFYTHLFDLATVVLPMFRPLRLLRLVTLLTALNRSAGNAFRGRVVVFVVGAASLLVIVSALAMLDAERHAPGALITTFPDGLWWALVTITTVGYGDLYPVTETGRLIAAAVMIGGIALLGVVTATLASWIVERVARDEDKERAASRRQVAELGDELRQIRELLEQRG